MVTFKKPKKLTRAELAEFLPTPRAIRAFEQLLDLIPTDLVSIYQYLLNTIQTAESDLVTNDDMDTIIANSTLLDINITLHTQPLVGKILVIKHGLGTNRCFINGTVDGSNPTELYLAEVIMIQADENGDWWIL